MKRPMCVIGLTLALTMLVAFLFSREETLLLSAAAFLTGLLCFALRRRVPQVVCVAFLTAAVGFCGHSLHQARHITPFQRAAGEIVVAEGLVTEASRGNRAVFYTVSARFPERRDLPAASLSLRSFGEMDYAQGDVIRAEIRLDDETVRPGGYGFSKGVYVSGLVSGQSQRLEGDSSGRSFLPHRMLIRMRQWMTANLYDVLPERSADAVAAVSLGLRSNLDFALYSHVNRAGTAHLLAVSGLHLSTLCSVVLSGLRRLRLSQRVSSFLAIAAALLFAALVGFSASIVRAFLMTAIALAAQAGPRRGDSLNSLGFAVAVISLFQPQWVLSRGFWFSACATLGILLLAKRFTAILHRSAVRAFKKKPGKALRLFLEAGAVSGAAYLATLPLTVLFNGWISLLSPLANALIAPFVTPLIGGGVLCALLGDFLPMGAVAAVTDLCAQAVLGVSRWISGLSFSTLPLDEGWMIALPIAGIAFTAAILMFRGGRKLWAYGAVLLLFLYGAGEGMRLPADRNRVELAVIEDMDTAVLLRDGDAVILGTPARNEANRLLRYLEFRGVRRIAAIVAPDCGEQIGSGMLRLRERYPVDCIIGPNDSYVLGQLAEAMAGIPVYSAGYASAELLGGARMEFLLPQGDILLRAGDQLLLKSGAEYAIIDEAAPEQRIPYQIGLFSGGTLSLDGACGLEPAPLGALLYGERRFRLEV